MPASNNEEVPRWIRSLVATMHFMMREGGLGLAIVIVFGVTPFINDVYYAVFNFPPDWIPILHLLLPTVAFAAWLIVRVWTYRPEEDSGDKSQRTPIIIYLVNAVTRTFGVFRVSEPAGKPRRSESQGLHLVGSVVLLAVGIAVFFLYFYVADRFTFVSSDYLPVASTSAHARDQKPTHPEIFVFPLHQTADFTNSVKMRGGIAFIVDNDPYWLSDRLKSDDIAESVRRTKLMLMGLLPVATALVTGATTWLSSLRKSGFGHPDGVEAASSHVPTHI
jgi:hypothetical protein